jgi:hypothetical protein
MMSGSILLIIAALHLVSMAYSPSAAELTVDIQRMRPSLGRKLLTLSMGEAGTDNGQLLPNDTSETKLGKQWWGGDDDRGQGSDDGDDDLDLCSGSKIKDHSYNGTNYGSTCAFVDNYCNGKGTGLLAYMSFHYCTMNGLAGLSYIILICWLL